jgi:type IV pilus assembly protein PilA
MLVGNMMNKDSGFTLIELMIVVSVITIMATIAVPNYQDRIVRAQLEEAMAISQGIKSAIKEFYNVHNRFPGDNKEAGVPSSEHLIGNFVKEIHVENGAIHVELGNRINAHAQGKFLTVRPVVVTENPTSPLSWVCGYAQPVDGMHAEGENKSNVPEKYLPFICRHW